MFVESAKNNKYIERERYENIVYLSLNIYIYIYREREREREKEIYIYINMTCCGAVICCLGRCWGRRALLKTRATERSRGVEALMGLSVA